MMRAGDRSLLLVILVLVSVAAAANAARADSRRPWAHWHDKATRALAAITTPQEPVQLDMSESLSRHLQARELLEGTHLPKATLEKLHSGLDLHAAALDKATAALAAQEVRAKDFVGAIKRAEASIAKRYYRALRAGLIPLPRPSLEEMRAALLDATGIDANVHG